MHLKFFCDPFFPEYEPSLPYLCTGDELQPRPGHGSRGGDRSRPVRDSHERRSHHGLRGRRGEPHLPQGGGPLQRVQGGAKAQRAPPARGQQLGHHLLGALEQNREGGQGHAVPADPEGQRHVQQPVLLHRHGQQDAEVRQPLSERDGARQVSCEQSRGPKIE